MLHILRKQSIIICYLFGCAPKSSRRRGRAENSSGAPWEEGGGHDEDAVSFIIISALSRGKVVPVMMRVRIHRRLQSRRASTRRVHPPPPHALIASLARSARLRSFGSRIAFLSRIDFGVTSTSSSSWTQA